MAAAAIAGIELSIPSDFKFGGTNKQSAYLSKFPLGKVPTLETQDGFHLSESFAIAYYTAERAVTTQKREQLLGSSPEERALIQQWIFFTSLHLEPTINNVCGWRKGYAKYDAEVERSSGEEFKRWLNYMEAAIKGQDWFVKGGTGPSLADIAIGSALYFAFGIYLDQQVRNRYPELTAWYKKLKDVAELASIFEGDMIDQRLEEPATKE